MQCVLLWFLPLVYYLVHFAFTPMNRPGFHLELNEYPKQTRLPFFCPYKSLNELLTTPNQMDYPSKQTRVCLKWTKQLWREYIYRVFTWVLFGPIKTDCGADSFGLVWVHQNNRTDTSLKSWPWSTYKRTLVLFVCSMNAVQARSDPNAASIECCWSKPAAIACGAAHYESLDVEVCAP